MAHRSRRWLPDSCRQICWEIIEGKIQFLRFFTISSTFWTIDTNSAIILFCLKNRNFLQRAHLSSSSRLTFRNGSSSSCIPPSDCWTTFWLLSSDGPLEPLRTSRFMPSDSLENNWWWNNFCQSSFLSNTSAVCRSFVSFVFVAFRTEKMQRKLDVFKISYYNTILQLPHKIMVPERAPKIKRMQYCTIFQLVPGHKFNLEW